MSSRMLRLSMGAWEKRCGRHKGVREAQPEARKSETGLWCGVAHSRERL